MTTSDDRASHARAAVLFAGTLVLAWVLRLPFGKWEISGYDRPWMFGFAVRLYRTSLFDFSERVRNFFIQVLAGAGGFELFPMFVWAGLSELLGLPLTARNAQIFYSIMEVATLGVVAILVRRFYSTSAALASVLLLAILPTNLWSSLFPLQTEWVLFLMVAGCLLLDQFRRARRAVLALGAGACFAAVTVCSRTFLVEYAVVTMIATAAIAGGSTREPSTRAMEDGRWSRTAREALKSPILGLAWLPMTLGVLFQFALYYHWYVKLNIPWGSLQQLTRHAASVKTWEGRIGLVEDLILFNGVILPVLLFVTLLVTVIRARHLPGTNLILMIWGALYFIPALLFQTRIDYAQTYLFPWTILLGVEVARTLRLAPRVAGAALAGTVLFTLAWGLHTVRDIRWPLPSQILMSAIGTDQYDDTRVLQAMCNDDYMKATGFWIRQHVPSNEVIGLYSATWQIWTLEIYSGRGLARGTKQLGIGLVEHEAEEDDLHVSPWNPKFHWAIVQHAYEGATPWVAVSENGARQNIEFVVGRLRYRLVGQIVDLRKPVVSIFSDRALPVVRIEAGEAEQSFDREYANLRSLAVSPFIGYGTYY